MPSTSTSQPSDGELWASRFNVGLARSQRVISSWLAQAPTTTTAADESDDEDFEAADERAPLGAKPKDSDLPESVRRSRISNDKLLEQIIGKRAANAKRKEREQANGKHVAPKVAVKPAVRAGEEDDDEEEEGRATAFVSKRKKAQEDKIPTQTTNVDGANDKFDEDAESPDPHTIESPVNEEEEGEGPKKRKAGSYLDEVLAKKAKKSKKQKKKKKAAV